MLKSMGVSSDEFPRVLVLSEMSATPQTGGGITLLNLLRGIEPEYLRFVCSDHFATHHPPQQEIAERTFVYKLWRPRGWRRKMIHLFLYEVQCVQARGQARVLQAWLRKWPCQVVLASPQGFEGLVMTRELQRAGWPVVLWLMDDHFSSFETARSYIRFWITPLLREVWLHAAERFVISKPMGEYFTRKLGRATWQMLHNAIPFPPKQRSKPLSKPLVIRYLGSVSGMYWDSIERLIRAVESLNGQVELEIYPNSLGDVPLKPDVNTPWQVKKSVSYDQVIPLLHTGDVSVLCASFCRESASGARFSLPTKLTEYMAAGRCILVHGPSDGASVRYAQQAGWGLVATEPTVECVRDALKRIIEDPDLTIALGKRAYEQGLQYHSLEKVQPRLFAALQRAAEMPISEASRSKDQR